MVVKRPTASAALLAAFNGLFMLYIAGWIAGLPDIRRLSDWRGPLFAMVLAIAITALTVISQIQAID